MTIKKHMPLQRTIKRSVTIKGSGLHTGRNAKVTLYPSAAGKGVVFLRKDIPGGPEIETGLDTLIDASLSPRRTSVGMGKARVDTIEHLMAVLSAFGIDDLRIEINGPEMPGLDGGALGYLSAVRDAGIVELNAPRKEWVITGDIEIEAGTRPRNDEDAAKGAIIRGFPADGLEISYALDYGDSAIPAQKTEFSFSESNMASVFEKEIAPARTFCSEREAEAALAAGLGKGGNTQNTVVFGKNGVIDNKLRFANECARHKVLDLMGDLFLLGGSIRGRIEAVKSGHALNYRLIREIAGYVG